LDLEVGSPFIFDEDGRPAARENELVSSIVVGGKKNSWFKVLYEFCFEKVNEEGFVCYDPNSLFKSTVAVSSVEGLSEALEAGSVRGDPESFIGFLDRCCALRIHREPLELKGLVRVDVAKEILEYGSLFPSAYIAKVTGSSQPISKFSEVLSQLNKRIQDIEELNSVVELGLKTHLSKIEEKRETISVGRTEDLEKAKEFLAEELKELEAQKSTSLSLAEFKYSELRRVVLSEIQRSLAASRLGGLSKNGSELHEIVERELGELDEKRKLETSLIEETYDRLISLKRKFVEEEIYSSGEVETEYLAVLKKRLKAKSAHAQKNLNSLKTSLKQELETLTAEFIFKLDKPMCIQVPLVVVRVSGRLTIMAPRRVVFPKLMPPRVEPALKRLESYLNTGDLGELRNELLRQSK